MRASVQGHLECVRAFLEAGADVAQAATSGQTALNGCEQLWPCRVRARSAHGRRKRDAAAQQRLLRA
jgi:hypothetical protein